MSDRERIGTAAPQDDCVQPFRLGSMAVRGRHVRLGPLVDQVLGHHAYPDVASELLGQLMALAALLASSIKYDGVFTVQTRSEGPIHMMVADVTSDGEIRAYAGFDRQRLDKAVRDGGDGGASVPRLLGPGYLAFTVDQGADTERYQGIVALEGATFSECAHNYFRQSEQIATGIKLGARKVGAKWRAGALMLQRVPREGGSGAFKAEEVEAPEAHDYDVPGADADEAWRRAVILMSSVSREELLDSTLSSDRLLYRLFHEESVWVYRPRMLSFGCRCSRTRVEATLRALPQKEIEQLKVDGRVVVTCQFCDRSEIFDDAQLAAVYAA